MNSCVSRGLRARITLVIMRLAVRALIPVARTSFDSLRSDKSLTHSTIQFQRLRSNRGVFLAKSIASTAPMPTNGNTVPACRQPPKKDVLPRMKS